MTKKIIFISLLLIIPALLAAQIPPPATGITYSLTLESSFSAAGVTIFPSGVHMFPGNAPLHFNVGEEITLQSMPFPIPTPPPCGSYTYYAFDSWAVNPMPASNSINLNDSSLTLTMDQDYVVTVNISQITNPGNPCNGIGLSTTSRTAAIGQEFTASLNMGFSQTLGAYDFTFTYNPDIITLDLSKGNQGVSKGPNGFISAISIDPSQGTIKVTGSNTDILEDPGYPDFLTLNWIAGPGAGDTVISLQIDKLIDTNLNTISIIREISQLRARVYVSDRVNYGDVNKNGIINIVDALMVAQYAVGSTVEGLNSEAADVNKDNIINIVDALIIAQYSVGLISSLPQ